jgi:hypothetical protein
MKKIVITFGVISGIITSVMMMATVPFADRIGFDKSMVVGYTSMVLAFLMVFFGIRSYRDNVGGGTISFGRAMGVGMTIVAISGLFYVATWEVIYFNFMPDFMEKYAAYAVEKARASGASPAELEAQIAEIRKYQELYKNPFFNFAYTFMEPLPVGFIISLVSSVALRRKRETVVQGAMARAV